jgi:PilZ domain.
MRHTQRMTHPNASLDLRRGPRVESRGSVTFEGEGHAGSGKIFNVSSWGCGVESITDVIPGIYVGVSLSLPNQLNPVVVELAAVRWSARRRFGVEFLSISQPSRTRLEQFLEQRVELS